jgi:hypothetical protein
VIRMISSTANVEHRLFIFFQYWNPGYFTHDRYIRYSHGMGFDPGIRLAFSYPEKTSYQPRRHPANFFGKFFHEKMPAPGKMVNFEIIFR